MVSLGFSSKAIIFPVRVLSKICICGCRRTSVFRLRWKVAFREDKALLVSLDTLLCPESCSNIVDGVRRLHLDCVSLPREVLGALPGEGLDGDLHVKIRRCWLVWIPSLSSILFLTLSMASLGSSLKAMVSLVRVLAKICIRGRRRASVPRLQMGSGFLRR